MGESQWVKFEQQSNRLESRKQITIWECVQEVIDTIFKQVHKSV